MNCKVTKELIFSYFTGNVSAIQRQTIARWAREISNEEQLYIWLEEFETLHPEYEPDLENAVGNFDTFLAEWKGGVDSVIPVSRQTGVQEAVKHISWFKWGVAAGISLLLGVTVWIYKDNWRFKTYATQIGERKEILLPDGSFVALTSNSMLRIPRWGFGQESRDVYLSGEAFFDVKHAPDHKRFVVKTGKEFEVEVLGTEFNVIARETGSRVLLKKGKIRLSLQNGRDSCAMYLKPGDLFALDGKNRPSLKTTTLPEIREAWQGHLYVFDKTSLLAIMSQLKEDHGITAEFVDKDLVDQTISGKFTANSIDELFELIEGILNIQITRQGHSVNIARPGH